MLVLFMFHIADHRGLMVTCLTVMFEIPQLNSIMRSCICHNSHRDV